MLPGRRSTRRCRTSRRVSPPAVPARPTSSSSRRAFKGGALSALSAVTVVAGATVALLAGGGHSVVGTPAATSESSPPQTRATNPATGTIAFARQTGAGTFGDAGGPVVEVTPEGAV